MCLIFQFVPPQLETRRSLSVCLKWLAEMKILIQEWFRCLSKLIVASN